MIAATALAHGLIPVTNNVREFSRVVAFDSRTGNRPFGVPAFLETADEVCLPFVVLAELRAGFLGGSRGRRNEQTLAQFLARPGVRVIFPDHETTHQYARLFCQLRRQGTPIPANDLWIASLVCQHGLHLLARDRHFDSLPQLPRIEA